MLSPSERDDEIIAQQDGQDKKNEKKLADKRSQEYLKENPKLTKITADFFSSLDSSIETLEKDIKDNKINLDNALKKIEDLKKEINSRLNASNVENELQLEIKKHSAEKLQKLDKISNELQKKKDKNLFSEKEASFLKQGVSEETVRIIVEKATEKNQKQNGFDSKEKVDLLFIDAIFDVYSEENKKQFNNKNIKTINELNSLLTDEFSRQQTSLLKGIILEQKDNNVTHFSTKSPLQVTNSNSNNNTSELGKMEGKTSAILYADKLKVANKTDKESFYEAIFLQGLYGESFERDADGKLKVVKGVISVASLPQDQVLKDETLEHLALFKKKYPNIDVRVDSLPQADKDKFEKLVNNQSANLADTMKFNSEINVASEAAKAAQNRVLQPPKPRPEAAPATNPPAPSQAPVATQAAPAPATNPPAPSQAPVATQAAPAPATNPPAPSQAPVATQAAPAPATNPPAPSQALKARKARKAHPIVAQPSRLAGAKAGQNSGAIDSAFKGIGGPALIFGEKKTNRFGIESKENMPSKVTLNMQANILRHAERREAEKRREAKNPKTAQSVTTSPCSETNQMPNSSPMAFLASSMNASQNSEVPNDPNNDFLKPA